MKNFLRRILPYSVLTKLLDLSTKVNEILANIKIALSLPLKRKPKQLILDIHIAEHCNLNCCGCGHFSPLAEPELYDVDEFKRDMERTGELFGHECEEIRLMGGEPLFHPEIITLMKVARDNFPKGKICIVSNGILLPQQKDEFWQACHDNDIEVSVTRYPIHLDEEKINKMAEKFDVKFQWFLNPNVKHFLYKKPIDLSGNGDCKKNFAMCIWAGGRCAELLHGKIYMCQFIPNVRHFNKRFGQNIPVTDADYIDIYQEGMDKDTIFQKLTEPVPICRFCDIKGVQGGIEWRVSKGIMDEWV